METALDHLGEPSREALSTTNTSIERPPVSPAQ
jgi:hypothetical protein